MEELETVLYSNNLEIGKALHQWKQKTVHGRQASLLAGEQHLPPQLRPVALVRRTDAEAVIAERDAEIARLRDRVTILEQRYA